MRYKQSAYRIDFKRRISLLKAEAVKANRLSVIHSDIRDMVFQCAIFQTSAALESYLKLIIESWFQEIRRHSLGSCIPDNMRGHLASRRFSKNFEQFVANKDEINLARSLGSERLFWSVMTGVGPIPVHITGKDIYDGASYPSYRNIHKLFGRFGITNVHDRIASILSRDVETMIESFQSIRTALAHSSPPAITIADVRDRLYDMTELVRALDRILYQHIMSHGGTICWK